MSFDLIGVIWLHKLNILSCSLTISGVDSVSGKTFPTTCPHDGSVIAHVSEGDKADVDLAVAAAKRAFHRNSEWRLLDASERGALINKLGDLVQRDIQYLAELESYNNGGLLSTMRDFLSAQCKNVRYLASLADKVQGDTIPADGELLSYTLKQPVGVAALILPWNGPSILFLIKVCNALAAGCTVVVKPAEQTPLTALALAALVAEAGFPKGVVNVVNGYGETAGVALTHHPDVAKISFTGSVEVGKLIQQAAGANNLKRVCLELGGKSPLIIMNDADLNLLGFMYNLEFMTSFVEAAVKYAQSIKIGNPADPTTQHGPQVDEVMFKKVLGYIEKGKKEGARCLTGGKRVGTTGYYIEPTVFVDVKDDMTIAKEEIFGPVQSIFKFETFEEVLERANNTSYGLAAGIFTNDINTALQFTKHAEAGNVWVNTYFAMTPQTPFGGFKDSGIGREGGLHTLDEYMEVKSVAIALPKKTVNL
ncbi:unnamed protein product [Arctia plantaginis]|uniref:Aldehyde dehydrogenase domain-containing protein n=1 Tax=Arctia plantaginis TaxID=874455 RepID=A0A8S1BBW6_ARCPL|nr:unnamed protein product [Arctia plantaginis]